MGPGDEHGELVDAVRDGDRSAEERVVALFYDRIRVMAAARTRDREAAREIAQDVLTAAITALRAGRMRDGTRLTAFVYGIARNHVSEHFRSGSRRPREEALDGDHAGAPPPDPLEEAERTRLVRAALAALEPDDRRILRMTLVEGLKPGAIAQAMGLSDVVVRARKSRAIKKVKDRLLRLVTNDAGERRDE